jgi:hypothetical protein
VCELKDVHYVEFDQAEEFMRVYEVDDTGIPTTLIRQDYWEHINESGMTELAHGLSSPDTALTRSPTSAVIRPKLG